MMEKNTLSISEEDVGSPQHGFTIQGTVYMGNIVYLIDRGHLMRG